MGGASRGGFGFFLIPAILASFLLDAALKDKI
jgi:hypothetical protein